MSKDWRGYRAIVVAGQRFRWTYSVTWHPYWITPSWLLVRDEAQPNRTFRVTWPARRTPQIRPYVARICIERGIELGWPQEHRVFELDGSAIPLMTLADGTRL